MSLRSHQLIFKKKNNTFSSLGKGDLVGCDISQHLAQHLTHNGGTVSTNMQDVVVKSSSDVKALTYCDLKSIHIIGLVDVLRLYPEYQQEFANDIQHDLTFNLREGYEAEHESDNNGPQLALPSISEDDENQSEGEQSPWASPMHNVPLLKSPAVTKKVTTVATTSQQLRHKRFLRRGNTLSSLRDRIVRQPATFSTSIDSLNDEDEDEGPGVGKKQAKVDTDLVTLHQNVTQLSIEVRNAIQALQDFTFSSIQSQADLNSRFPARSIPNLPGTQATNDPSINVETEQQSLTRSSSHPAEIWNREVVSLDVASHLEPFEDYRRCRKPSLNLPEKSSATQTDDCDFETVHRIVRANPRLVIAILGMNLQSKYQRLTLHGIEEQLRNGACILAETPTHEAICNGIPDNNKSTPPKYEKHVSIQSESANKRYSAGQFSINDDEDIEHQINLIQQGHGESCVIILNEDEMNDECHNGAGVKKRYSTLIVNKTPLTNRFSAGDAELAARGGSMATLPSTRSLKEM